MTIRPGCWLVVPFYAEVVCIEVTEKWVFFRYKATHELSGETLWVYNGVPASEARFLRHADATSRKVLSLEGPYGAQKPSDPRSR